MMTCSMRSRGSFNIAAWGNSILLTENPFQNQQYRNKFLFWGVEVYKQINFMVQKLLILVCWFLSIDLFWGFTSFETHTPTFDLFCDLVFVIALCVWTFKTISLQAIYRRNQYEVHVSTLCKKWRLINADDIMFKDDFLWVNLSWNRFSLKLICVLIL